MNLIFYLLAKLIETMKSGHPGTRSPGHPVTRPLRTKPIISCFQLIIVPLIFNKLFPIISLYFLIIAFLTVCFSYYWFFLLLFYLIISIRIIILFKILLLIFLWLFQLIDYFQMEGNSNKRLGSNENASSFRTDSDTDYKPSPKTPRTNLEVFLANHRNVFTKNKFDYDEVFCETCRTMIGCTVSTMWKHLDSKKHKNNWI